MVDCWIDGRLLGSSFAKGAPEDWPTLSALEGEREAEGRAGVTGEALVLMAFISAVTRFMRSISASCRASRACSAMSVAVGMGGRAGGSAGLGRGESGGGSL